MSSSSMTPSCMAGRVHYFTRDGDVIDIRAWDQEKVVDEEHEHLRPRQVVAGAAVVDRENAKQ